MSLDLRLSVLNQLSEPFWYVHLGEVPFYQFVEGTMEMPCSLSTLNQSAEIEGTLPIFVCDCGDRGCNSNWVEVKFDGDDILWTRVFDHTEDGQLGELLGKVDWAFTRKDYEETIARAIELSAVIESQSLFTEPGSRSNQKG